MLKINGTQCALHTPHTAVPKCTLRSVVRQRLQMLLCCMCTMCTVNGICLALGMCVWRWRRRRRQQRENMLHWCSSFSSVQFNSIEFFVGRARQQRRRQRHQHAYCIVPRIRQVRPTEGRQTKNTRLKKKTTNQSWKKRSNSNNNTNYHMKSPSKLVAGWFPVNEEGLKGGWPWVRLFICGDAT